MPIYFDHAATTRVLPEAAAAALHAMTEEFGNPSSRHALGLEAASALAAHRATIANALGDADGQLLFTSGGTESNNWAISIMEQLGHRRGKHIITTALEHAAVLEPMKRLEQQGYEVTYLEPSQDGRISPQQVEDALRPDTIIVSMMLVNNETGVLLPVAEVSKLLKAKQSAALLHTDAVQGFLKIPFSARDLGADFISISAHKIGGPKGCGGLYVRKGIKASPLLLGGGQEQGLRSGTEGTALIAAFAAAATIGRERQTPRRDYLLSLKDYALSTLSAALPRLVVVSPGDAPHICAISMPGYPSEMLVRDLSDRGIYVSSGSACHKGKPSHVFGAMKLPNRVSMGVLRISFAEENTREDVDALVEALTAISKERVPMKG